MTDQPQPETHPDFGVLADSWQLTLQADGYAANTQRGYSTALARLAEWLAEHHPGGLRLSEVAGLTVDDVDVRERMVFVSGKGSNRSGPRFRAVPLGIKATQALDRYLRERRKHPYAETKPLWLGDRNRPPLSRHGIDAMIERRATRLGLKLHAHQFRHTRADAFRAAGGSEGDLMTLGGWRSRQMLDRYGRTNATGRAKEAYRRLSFGDRL